MTLTHTCHLVPLTHLSPSDSDISFSHVDNLLSVLCLSPTDAYQYTDDLYHASSCMCLLNYEEHFKSFSFVVVNVCFVCILCLVRGIDIGVVLGIVSRVAYFTLYY